MYRKNLVLVGSNSELALEIYKKLKNSYKFSIYRISSKDCHDDTDKFLRVNDYILEKNKILEFINNVSNPYIIFFNGYLKEDRPTYFPNTSEIIKTAVINYYIPKELFLSLISNKNYERIVFISSIAAIKQRQKNFIYGYFKKKIRRQNLNNEQ